MVNYYGKATPASGGSGGGSGDAVWGSITGTLSDQTDLQTALNAKQDTLTAGSGISISDNVISATISGLTNIATGTNSLTILGTASTHDNTVNIGYNSETRSNMDTTIGYQAIANGGNEGAVAVGEESAALGAASVVIGRHAQALDSGNIAIGNSAKIYSGKQHSIAIGRQAEVNATGAIQLGGYLLTNNENGTFKVATYHNNTWLNNTLLESDGTIPNDRLNVMTGADGTNAGTKGAVPAPTATDNTKFLRGDGTWAEAGGSVSFDGSTINENASDELQTIGVIDKNSGSALGFWHGTQAQYDVGGTVKDTYYDWEYITDSWNIATLPDTSYKNNIVYGNNVYIMGGYNAYKSTDGHTWSQISSVSTVGYGVRVCFGGGKFVLLVNRSTSGYYSNDGETWNTMTIPTSGSTHQWIDVIYANNMFVAISDGGKIIYSADGENWSESSDSVSYELMTIAYGNGRFIIAAGNNTPLTSTDGENWTASTMPSNKNLRSITFGNGKFVSVDNANLQVVYSTDGTSWITAELPSTYSGTGKYILFGNGLFIIYCKNNSSNLYYLYSSDGINYERSTNTISLNSIDFMNYVNGLFIGINTSNGNNKEAYGTISANSVYTLDENPTTSSQVYSAPEVTSALTITAVGTGTITLSDTNTYKYNAGGNAYSYYSVGELHPNYVCNIDGVGLKIGDTDIANLASYSAFTGATGSVAGSAGLVPAPTTSDVDKYLKGDGTWATVSGGSGLQNTATGSGSLTILGTASSAMNGTNVGVGSQAGEFGATAFGNNAKATTNGTLALGGLAEATDIQAYQIGWGTNNEGKTLYVGWGTNDNYKLLDGTTGKIPNDRINGATGSFTSQDGKTVTVTNGVITSIV